MQIQEFLSFLRDNEMPVFNINEAERIIQKDRSYVKLFLHRCIEQNVLGRAVRGVYYLKEGTNELEIASGVIADSYVSLISALSYYELTTQMPNTVYVLSPTRHSIVKDILGYDIVFKQVKRDMFYGFHRRNAGRLVIADPEKAIVDLYYFNDVNDLDEDALDPPARVDIGMLIRYALRSGVKRVVRGVADLIEKHGYERESKELTSRAGLAGYHD